MKKKTKWIVVLVLVLVPFLTVGCGDTSQQRLESQRELIAVAQATLASATEQVQSLEAAIAEFELAMADPEIDPEYAAKMKELTEKAKENYDKAIAKKAQIEKDLAAYQARLDAILANAAGSANLGDEIEAVGETIRTGSSWLPAEAGPIGILIGTIIGIIGRTMAKRARLEKEEQHDALVDVVKSVDNTLKAAKDAPLDKEAIKGTLSVQNAKTVGIVAEIKANLKNA